MEELEIMEIMTKVLVAYLNKDPIDVITTKDVLIVCAILLDQLGVNIQIVDDDEGNPTFLQK